MGEAELFLGIWGAKANTFRETRTLFAGRQGDQCIIFRDQGSTDPPGGPVDETELTVSNFMLKDHIEIICILERGEKYHSYKIKRKKNYFTLVTKFPNKNGERH